MVATIETIKDSVRQAKNDVVGEDDKTHVGHILTFQLSTTYVLGFSEFATPSRIRCENF